MSAALSRSRVVLRAAVATAALAGALCAPTVALAADLGTASPECTVTKTIGASFGGWTIDLTNSTDGPTATLKDDTGKTWATVDRTHPEDLTNGLKIKDADTAAPLLLDRSQGDPAPWRTTPFPTLPDDCTTTDGDGKDATQPAGTGTQPGTGSETGTGTGTGGETGSGTGSEAGAVADSGTDTGASESECMVTKTIGASFGGWTIDLTNSTDGPTAVLKDATGKTWATVDRAHPEDLTNGLRIKDADTAAPLLLDRSQGDPAPWRTTPFPTLPDDCTTTDGGAGTTPSTQPSTGSTQTRVVPAGGVAAGAESTEGTDTVLLAGGATLSAAALAGLAFVVRRRRGIGAGV
ncbi:hypothetical protein [Streptomyces sp. NPDC003719]